MTETLPPPPITVGGGAAGHAALTEDLHVASWTIDGAAVEVDEAAHQLRMAAFWADRAMPDAVAAVRGPLGSADAGIWGALEGPGGAQSVARDVADAGVRLADVAQAYEDAEAAARHQVSAGERLSRAAQDLFGTGLFVVRKGASAVLTLHAIGTEVWARGADVVATGVLHKYPVAGAGAKLGAGLLNGRAQLTQDLADAVNPDGLPPSTGYLNGATVGGALGFFDIERQQRHSDYELAAGAVAGALLLLERIAKEPLYTGARPRIGSKRQVDPPAGVADLIAAIQPLAAAESGAVSVDTITHPDGSRSHIVTVPGTNDWGVSHESPFDAAGNAVAVVGRESDAERLVLEAMAQAGIQPDEPVMMVGHSQGGIIATNIAAKAAGDYRVTHVMTAGSPTDRLHQRSDVEYLHLSSEQEFVHQLDGRDTVDRPNVTTVKADLRAAADPELADAGRFLVDAHSLDSYVVIGKAADASPSRSMAAWRQSAQDFIGSGTAQRREYEPTFSAR